MMFVVLITLITFMPRISVIFADVA